MTDLSPPNDENNRNSLPLERLCRNQDERWIPAGQGVKLLSFRMRSFRVMGNRPS